MKYQRQMIINNNVYIYILCIIIIFRGADIKFKGSKITNGLQELKIQTSVEQPVI